MHMINQTLKCPECDGTTVDKISEQMCRCQDCSHVFHELAGMHADLLLDLRDGDDPAMADLANTVLTFKSSDLTEGN